MAQASTQIRFHRQDRTLTVQIEGRATAQHSPAVRRLAEACLRGGAGLRIDLRNGTHMDSTFVGMLLWFRRSFAERGSDGFALVSPSPECEKILQQMGLAPFFEVEAPEEPEHDAWTELTPDTQSLDTLAFKRNVVEAHQELVGVGGPVGERYRALAEMAALELEAALREADRTRNTN